MEKLEIIALLIQAWEIFLQILEWVLVNIWLPLYENLLQYVIEYIIELIRSI